MMFLRLFEAAPGWNITAMWVMAGALLALVLALLALIILLAK